MCVCYHRMLVETTFLGSLQKWPKKQLLWAPHYHFAFLGRGKIQESVLPQNAMRLHDPMSCEHLSTLRVKNEPLQWKSKEWGVSL